MGEALLTAGTPDVLSVTDLAGGNLAILGLIKEGGGLTMADANGECKNQDYVIKGTLVAGPLCVTPGDLTDLAAA